MMDLNFTDGGVETIGNEMMGLNWAKQTPEIMRQN